jgi:nitronate monooxygenase
VLGADGIVAGTRFWSAAEALTPAAMTDFGARATGDDTVRTKTVDRLRGVPWPEEFSFRVLRNAITDKWAAADPAAIPFGTLAQAYADARADENLDVLPTVAGECIGLIADRPPAAAIVEQMMTQARAQLERAARFASY